MSATSQEKRTPRRMSPAETAKLRELESMVRSRMFLFSDEAFQLQQLRAKRDFLGDSLPVLDARQDPTNVALILRRQRLT